MSRIRHEEHEHRGAFFIEEDDERTAEMTYSRANEGLVIIDHTEVRSVDEGRDVGRSLLDALVTWARETGTKVKATCTFAAAQFDKDASIRDVLG